MAAIAGTIGGWTQLCLDAPGTTKMSAPIRHTECATLLGSRDRHHLLSVVHRRVRVLLRMYGAGDPQVRGSSDR